MKKRILKVIGFGLLGLILIVTVSGIALNEPMPEYQTGPAADSLAREMMTALGAEAWEQTGAVTFTFAGKHRYLWDRKRQWARIQWNGHDVLLRLSDQSGVVRKEGKVLQGEEKNKALEKAWSMWCNDSFWFCAPMKCFDPGTVRGIVKGDRGEENLIVVYESGGVTPGDAYLWLLDENKRPTGWKMWVSILPVGGVYSSWTDWVTLDTGAKIASTHAMSSFDLKITDISGGKDLKALGYEKDPFAELE